MKGYKISKDYKHLKELLDKDYKVVLVYRHDTTQRIFSGIANRVSPISGGVNGFWYSLDCWSFFPTINKESFEDYCACKGFSFIVPEG